MNKKNLLFRNLKHYRQVNLAVIAGMAVAVAVIVGALSVGNSVKTSLLNIVKTRLGLTEYAIISEDLFSASLAEKIENSSDSETAPILLFSGTASDPQGRFRANQVNVIGINDQFTHFSLKEKSKSETKMPSPGNAVINKSLADRLNLKKGDDFILRMAKPSLLPVDVPLLSDNDNILSFRLSVKAIAPDDFPGNFSFRSSQLPPSNVFLPLEWLSEKAAKTGKANVIIAKKTKPEELRKALDKVWSLKNVGLNYKIKENGTIDLKYDKIFIPETVRNKAKQIPGYQEILTYFVNSIELKNKQGKSLRQTPYSFVCGIQNGLNLPEKGINQKIADNEIILNQWLADDLHAKAGDTIQLKYFISNLAEKKHSFTVKAIIPIVGLAADRSLMPDFPGLSDTEKCAEWDASIPIKTDMIRDKDEAYWKKYKGTPKAFISLRTAQLIWGNRFGMLTLIRFTPKEGVNPLKNLRNSLKPTDFGLEFQAVKKEAEKSASNGVDFGGLFIGLSFFLLFSAFMLTTLLFLLGVESRYEEFSILESLGFSSCEVRKLFIQEGLILACIGAAIGAPLGLLYNKAILYCLGSVWQGAIGTTSISSSVNPWTPFFGAIIGIAIAWITMRISLGRYTKNIQKANEEKSVSTKISLRIKIYLVLSIILCIAAIVLIIMGLTANNPSSNPTIFFTCGGMLILSDWFGWRFCLDWIHKHNTLAEFPSPFRLALKNITYKPMRSMAAVILLSCGIFLTIAVAINKRTTQNPRDKASGTGGYSFFIKTSIPIPHDMNTLKGKKSMGLDMALFKDISFVNMSLSEGDNASCLNLNKVKRPAILGVDFAKFANPQRFTFVSTSKGISRKKAWLKLGKPTVDNNSAVADQEVIMWSMGKSIGSDLEITNDIGKKRNLKLKGALASSIFQGYVLIPKSSFILLFPYLGGARCLLVDVPKGKEEKIKAALADALIDYGAEITTCSSRLDEFYRVANTYLLIFLILRGLGVLVGTAGFGAIVLRNITERRFELAIMNATGYSKSLIRKIVTMEHTILILVGGFSGGITAFVALIPSLYSSSSNPPYMLIIILFVLIMLCGIISVYIATCFATRGSTLQALRKE